MEEKTKKITVEMTLEETADLYDKGWTPLLDKYSKKPLRDEKGNIHWTNMLRRYHFIPNTLSETIDYLVSNDREHDGRFYSSGVLYVARKNKERIEVFEFDGIHPENFKKGDKRVVNISGMQKDNGNWIVPIYEIYSRVDFLDMDSITKLSDYKHTKFEIPKNGQMSLTDISSLPIWDHPEDYENFLRYTYGNEKIDATLKSCEKFLVVQPNEVSENWTLLTSSLSPMAYCYDYGSWLNAPLHALSDDTQYYRQAKSLILRGTVIMPSAEPEAFENAFEGRLVKDYVKPKNLGNGVITMAEDRIPKYLQRVLGLKGEK